jgi:F-box and leucine-rich repeat protein GRR1
LTDRAIVALTRACPLLLELDLATVPQLSNDSTIAIFFNAAGLRELRMNDNAVITSSCIPDLGRVPQLDSDSLLEVVGAYPWYLTNVDNPKAMFRKAWKAPPDMNMSLLRPVATSFDQLRVVDFTSCGRLDDQAIDNLISNAPQLRSVTLTKCTHLTNDAIHSIARLGKHLHFLHLGHVSL